MSDDVDRELARRWLACLGDRLGARERAILEHPEVTVRSAGDLPRCVRFRTPSGDAFVARRSDWAIVQ